LRFQILTFVKIY